MFTSVPAVPAQPDQVAYSPADLELFSYPNPVNPAAVGTLTRSLYLALNGVQAPPYDATNPTRNWYDQSSTPGYPSPGSYLVIAVQGTVAAMNTIAVPANVAVPNLAGAYQYAAWVNSPTTPAEITFPGFSAQPLSTTFLCTLADAEAVAAALPSGTAVGEDSTDSMVTWNTEVRRRYTVNVPNGPQGYYAAPARAQMTAIQVDVNGSYVSGGVGSPGTFAVNGQAITWQPSPDPGLSAGPAMSVPCRALISDGSDQEVLVPGPLGMGVQIVRLDLLAAAVSTAGNDGGFSSDQAAWVIQALQAIGESLKLDLPVAPVS